jgi:hypothetical protein
MRYAIIDPIKGGIVQHFLKRYPEIPQLNIINSIVHEKPYIGQKELNKKKRKEKIKLRWKNRAKRLNLGKKPSDPIKEENEIIHLVDKRDIIDAEAIPTDAEEIVVFGVMHGCGDAIAEMILREKDFIYIDRGYSIFKRPFRVTVNETAPTELRAKGRKFEHNIELQKWNGGNGNKIIVIPPSKLYQETFAIQDFFNEVLLELSKVTDREIVVRPKPNKKYDLLSPDWEEQIKDTYCVVTWGSSMALDAMIRGIPTISLGWCPAKPASFTFKDLETGALKIEPDRMRILDSLTWSQFGKDELRDYGMDFVINEKGIMVPPRVVV